jgi:uncharacterized membrane protein YdbT with pleckstrin-like domain
MHDHYSGVDPASKKVSMASLSEGEQLIAVIKRHPFGIIIIYLQTAFALLLAMFLIVVLLPSFADFFGLSNTTSSALVGLLGLTVTVFIGLFLLVATWLYFRAELRVTTRNITYINQIGIFNRKVSEIAMTNLEDVTSQKKGIFATIFNFGTLAVETAGEQNNFVYTYCDNPVVAAKIILDTRESFLIEHGE